MSAKTDNLVNDVVQGVCRATETNLRLQQELLLRWSRCWPGFSGRPVEPGNNFQQAWNSYGKTGWSWISRIEFPYIYHGGHFAQIGLNSVVLK